MGEAAHLGAAMERQFSNPQAGAFAHFVTVTDGLSGAQAAAVPAPRFNSVWALANHVMLWMEALRLGLLGVPLAPRDFGLENLEGGGWPPVGEVSDARWLAARTRALEVNRALARVIEAIPDAELEHPVAAYFGARAASAVHGILAHNAYHTAEIIGSRHMLGLWVDHPYV